MLHAGVHGPCFTLGMLHAGVHGPCFTLGNVGMFHAGVHGPCFTLGMFHAGVHVPDCVTTAHTHTWVQLYSAAPAAYNRFHSFLTDGKPADTNNQPIFILQAQFLVHRYLVSKPALASGPSINWNA